MTFVFWSNLKENCFKLNHKILVRFVSKFQWLTSIILLTVVASCSFFTEEDKHPEVEDFETFIKNKNYFEPIYEKPTSYSGDIYILKTNKFLVVSPFQKEIENQEDSVKQVNGDWYYNLDLRNFDGKQIFTTTIEDESYFVDDQGNIYVDNHQYTAPDYLQKKAFPVVNINDSLYWFRNKHSNHYNTDSLNLAYLKEAEKKYEFKYSDTLRYVISQNKLILFTNLKATNQSQLELTDLKEFDEPALMDIRSTGRLDIGTSFYYYYYKIGNLKFKYSDDKNGFEQPKVFKFKGNTYLYHDYFGIYKLK